MREQTSASFGATAPAASQSSPRLMGDGPELLSMLADFGRVKLFLA